MQIKFRPRRIKCKGYALLITFVFLAVTLMAFGSMMYWMSTNANITKRNNLFNVSESAAEGAAENAISRMDRDFLYQSLNDPSTYQSVTISQTNWPITFNFSGTNSGTNYISVAINPVNYSTNWVTLNSSIFNGLSADVANCIVIATATPLNQSYNVSATVNEQVQLAAIPVFQYGVFYNMDMDFGPGQAMTLNGKVMVNGNIWMCPMANATFNNSVSASLLVTNADDPNDQQNHTFNANYLKSPYGYKDSGSPISHVDSLVMPIDGSDNNPSNVEAILNLPPSGLGVPNDVGYAITNNMYLYNGADLIISNAASGVNGNSLAYSNLFVYYSADKSRTPRLNLLTNDVIVTNIQTISSNSVIETYSNSITPIYDRRGRLTGYSTNIVDVFVTTNYFIFTTNYCPYYSFVTNVTFYDYRESATVQAVQIDIAQFGIWMTNQLTRNTNYVAGYPWNLENGGSDGAHGDKGHCLDSIYVYNSVPFNSSQLPAVRVVNGSQLPNPDGLRKGLTVATPFPIYVLGDYNIKDTSGTASGTDTTHTYPAALMGDAVTILSTGWHDSYSSGTSLNNRNPCSTMVNAACLEGIVQSVTVGGSKHYSGGLENFLRLLENWTTSTILTYNGSIVVMFPSIYATNYWSGNYYGVPRRAWGFDANFAKGQQYLPPLTPEVKAVVRGQWGQWNAY